MLRRKVIMKLSDHGKKAELLQCFLHLKSTSDVVGKCEINEASKKAAGWCTPNSVDILVDEHPKYPYPPTSDTTLIEVALTSNTQRGKSSEPHSNMQEQNVASGTAKPAVTVNVAPATNALSVTSHAQLQVERAFWHWCQSFPPEGNCSSSSTVLAWCGGHRKPACAHYLLLFPGRVPNY